MPIYEYRCQKCGHQFETLSSVGEDGSSLVCPLCRKKGLDRILSVFSSSGAESKRTTGGGCGHSHRGGFR